MIQVLDEDRILENVSIFLRDLRQVSWMSCWCTYSEVALIFIRGGSIY